MSAIDAEPFPKGALYAVAALLAVTVGGTAAVRLAQLSNPPAPISAPAAVAAIDLRFFDQADGSIAVRQAGSGVKVATLAPGTNGFVRGVMRGLARDRRSRRIGESPPFRLSQDAGGRLWLQDSATHRLIDLEAFGTENRAAFADFLRAQPGART